MAGKKGGAGENSKKAQGQARKADAAAAKKNEKVKQAEAAEAAEWDKGAKDSSKKEAAAAKAAEQARKKAELRALEAEEQASLKTAKTGNAKTAQKKGGAPSRGLDLSQLDAPAPGTKASALSATGIDNALDALSLTTGANDSIDKHPERRFKAAYKEFETKKLEEMKDDKTLRRNQKIEIIRKDFEKHPDNPFNQVSAKYNTTREELAQIKQGEKDKIEKRLGSNP